MSGLGTASGQHSGADYSFRSIWNVASDGQVITIPVVSGNLYEFDVDWGDGIKESYNFSNQSTFTHTYATAGIYKVRITGLFPRIYFAGGGSRTSLIEVEELGDVGWTNWYGAFRFCNQCVSIHRSPGLPNVATTSLQYCFDGCTKLVSIPPLKNMVDKITSFYFGFRDARSLIEIDTRGVVVQPNSSGLYVGFNGMFALERVLGVADWITTGAQRIDFMIRSASSLVEFDTSTWDTRNFLRYAGAFAGNNGQLTLDYRNWDISRAIVGSDIGSSNAISQTKANDDIWSDALINWSKLNFVNNQTLYAPIGSKYRCDALWARNKLAIRHTIIDAGPVSPCDGLILAVNISEPNETFTLPAGNIGTYNATIDWNDTTTSAITAYNDANLTHTYTSPGEYSVIITGDFPKVEFAGSADAHKVIAIANWGNYGATNTDSSNSFEGCQLQYIASDSTLPLCTDASAMFKNTGYRPAVPNPTFTDTTVYDSNGDILLTTSGDIPASWARYTADVRYLKIGSTCTALGTSSFRSHDLTEINIPSNVISIGRDAFIVASQLITLNLSEGLQVIGDSAFNQNNLNGDIILPSTLTSVDSQAFFRTFDSGIRRYHINSPASIFIGSGTFENSNANDIIYVHPDYLSQYDATWRSTHGFTATIAEWVSYPYPMSSDDNYISIPDGFNMSAATNVDEMFSGSSVSLLPDSFSLPAATSIYRTFYNCANLQTLISPNLTFNLASDAIETFAGCKRLTQTNNITLQNAANCTAAFSACGSLVSIDTPLSPGNMNNGTSMFAGVTASTQSYSDFLINIDNVNSNTFVTFDGGGSKYNLQAQGSRDNLVNVKSWNITDGGFDSASIDYYAIQILNSAVSRWKLDEGSGITAIDDLSGNNGTYQNNDTIVWDLSSGEWSTDTPLQGVFTSIFKPTGYGRVNNCGPAGTFSFIPQTGVFTLESWIKLNGNPFVDRVDRILGTSNDPLEVGFELAYENRTSEGSPASLCLRMSDSTGTLNCESYDTSGFTWDNNWHHVVVTGDGASVVFYIDKVGSPGSPGIAALAAASSPNRPLSIGDTSHTTQLSTFDGNISTVTIYDTALTPTDVSTLYDYATAFTTTIDISTPIAYVDLTDTSGIDAFNNMSLTNTSNVNVELAGAPDPRYDCVDFTPTGYMTSTYNPTTLGFTTGEYTVNLWVKFDSYRIGQYGNWLWNWRSSGSRFGQFLYSAQGATVTEYMLFMDVNVVNSVNTPTWSKETNKWFMFTTVYNKNTGVNKLYIDGQLEQTLVGAYGSAMPNTNLPFALGVASWSLGFTQTNFDGKMFGLGLWNKELTTDEISTLYNKGKGRVAQELLTPPSKSNLVSWHKMEDATDSHTGGYDLTDTDITYVAGRDGNAAEFNGQLGTSNMIRTSYPYPTGAHTVACWINVDISNPTSNGYGFVGCWNNTTNEKISLLYIETNGRPRFLVSQDGTSAYSPYAELQISNFFTASRWYHIAGVYDPDNLQHKLYIDGKVRDTETAPASLAGATAPFLQVGGWSDTDNRTIMDGKIDDVCVFNTALTDEEMLWLASPFGKYENL